MAQYNRISKRSAFYSPCQAVHTFPFGERERKKQDEEKQKTEKNKRRRERDQEKRKKETPEEKEARIMKRRYALAKKFKP